MPPHTHRPGGIGMSLPNTTILLVRHGKSIKQKADQVKGKDEIRSNSTVFFILPVYSIKFLLYL